MTRYARLLVMALGSLVVGIGLVGLAAPSKLLEFGRSLQTPGALYAVAAVRVAFGALLLWVASVSRMPRTLRIMGPLIIAAGLLTPLFGVERTQRVVEWWASQEGLFMRVPPGFAVLVGLFIIHAASAPRGSARRG